MEIDGKLSLEKSAPLHHFIYHTVSIHSTITTTDQESTAFRASAFHDFRSITNLIVVSTMLIFCHLRNRNSYRIFLLDINKILHDFPIFSLCLDENIAKSFLLL